MTHDDRDDRDDRPAALQQLDLALLKLRRWGQHPPSMDVPTGLAVSLGGRTPVTDAAKVYACEAVADLRREGLVTVKQVAEHLTLDASTASRLLGDCDAAGLVQRQQDPNDRRRTLLTLTEHGDAVAGLATRVRLRILARLVTDWSPDQLTEFTDRFDELASRIGCVVGALVRGEVPDVLRDALVAEGAAPQAQPDET